MRPPHEFFERRSASEPSTVHVHEVGVDCEYGCHPLRVMTIPGVVPDLLDPLDSGLVSRLRRLLACDRRRGFYVSRGGA